LRFTRHRRQGANQVRNAARVAGTPTAVLPRPNRRRAGHPPSPPVYANSSLDPPLPRATRARRPTSPQQPAAVRPQSRVTHNNRESLTIAGESTVRNHARRVRSREFPSATRRPSSASVSHPCATRRCSSATAHVVSASTASRPHPSPDRPPIQPAHNERHANTPPRTTTPPLPELAAPQLPLARARKEHTTHRRSVLQTEGGWPGGARRGPRAHAWPSRAACSRRGGIAYLTSRD
jgi:hypothetical protein